MLRLMRFYKCAPKGDPASTWVQGRILNYTSGEVVATTERHNGGKISVRLSLPRATGVQTYYMQYRGKSAGLEAVSNWFLLRREFANQPSPVICLSGLTSEGDITALIGR